MRIALLVLMATGVARAAGLPPVKALKHFRVPDGFEVRIAAAEPLVRQPVSISFDDRGRLWVLQYLQYPNPAGLTPVAVDQFLRTKYDRVPEPPPKGPKGADKLTILYDRDDTGRFRKSKDFVTGLNLATGFCVGGGGVYVAQPPYLLFYEDRDGDDVPDGDPKVVLSGFGTEDSHAYANSLQWGPDGWLYGAQGSTVTANVRGIEFQQGVWRYHPPTDRFELFAEGGGNIWGLDFDRNARLIAGTNFGGVACMHVVQGGYYVKNWGKHGALHNPHTYGFFDHIPCPNFKGGHVSCGGIVYRGGTFPKHFEGRYLTCNLLSNAVYWYDLTPHGSSFSSRQAGELLTTDDRHFRPVDLTVGSDGAVYVADWYDERANHVDPVDNWDKTTGRIYRIAPKAPHGPVTPRYATALVEFWRRVRDGDSPDVGLTHTDEFVRAWAVRLLGDGVNVTPRQAAHLAELARSEPSAIVRNQLACTARRLPALDGLAIVRGLLAHADDERDPMIPLLTWWAVEAHAVRGKDLVAELIAQPDMWRSPISRTMLLERLGRRYVAEDDFATTARLLELAPGRAERELLARGMERALDGRRLSHVPPPLAKPFGTLQDELPSMLALRIAVRLGDGAAFRQLRTAAADVRSPDQAALLELLGEINPSDALPVALDVLRGGATDAVRSAALSVVGGVPDRAAAETVASLVPKLPSSLRAKAVSVLASRPESAETLLAAVDAGRLAAKDVPLDVLRRVAGYRHDALDTLIAKHWGRVAPESSGEKLAHVRHLSARLREGTGDVTRGIALFKQHCANCHTLHGDGGKVGPDLTTIDRRNRDWLLTQIVDPSAIVRPEFVSYDALTRDGRLLQGLLAEQSPQVVTIVDSKGERATVPRAKLESLEPSRHSLMPEKLLDAFSNAELRDLFAYLQSNR